MTDSAPVHSLARSPCEQVCNFPLRFTCERGTVGHRAPRTCWAVVSRGGAERGTCSVPPAEQYRCCWKTEVASRPERGTGTRAC